MFDWLGFNLIAVTLQTITVNATQPCFLNFTNPENMWQNCGATIDYLNFVLLPWEYITGGNFSMVLVSVMVMFSYIKYHKAIYPILIGSLFLPVSFFLFPATFLSWAFIMAFGGAIAIIIWYVLTRQTKEY